MNLAFSAGLGIPLVTAEMRSSVHLRVHLRLERRYVMISLQAY